MTVNENLFHTLILPRHEQSRCRGKCQKKTKDDGELHELPFEAWSAIYECLLASWRM